MDTPKLASESKNEVLPERSTPPARSAKPKAVSAGTKKAGKRATAKKAKAKLSARKATENSKSEDLVCRYCGSKDLAPSFIKRRDRRCRKCFSKRYGSPARTGKKKADK
ncbi:MAG: hypothetical protein Q7S58_15780 [Candidatus Binatus sp.]|uniref:hypothetical protein n=1 Tax=Candidatus Binatus sp. TaxID=2811406 RepID=UPI0027212D0B|nr:hypothetical protein [Candidatus Binatus sp.]MDO8433861.1 hypothetical protein [Candidatus Binatus sp.]